MLTFILSHPVETMAGPSEENSNPFTVAAIAGCAVDASTQIFFWWTWRESNPRPECLTLRLVQQFFNYLRFLVARIAASRIRFLAIGRVITFSF